MSDENRASRRSVLASIGGSVAVAEGVGAVDTTGAATDYSTVQYNQDPLSSIESDWPKPYYDAGLSNSASGSPGPTTQIEKVWEFSSEMRLTSPVVADGVLYVSDENGTVFAIDARSGKVRWQQSLDGEAGTPWVEENSIYIPTTTSIVALDVKDGAKRWTISAPNKLAFLVAEHGVYFISNEDAVAVKKLSLTEGDEQWQTTITRPFSRRLFSGGDAIFVSTADRGRIPWVISQTDGEINKGPSEAGFDFNQERFYHDGTIFSAEPFFGGIKSSHIHKQENNWSRGVSSQEIYLSGDRDRLVARANHRKGSTLHAYSPSDGEVKWTLPVDSGSSTRPIIGGKSVVDIGTSVRAINPISGTVQWTRKTENIGERAIIVDDMLFATSDNSVRALR